jgi:hypothetical protein
MIKKIFVLLLVMGSALPAKAEEKLQINWTPYIWGANLSVDMDFGAGPIGTDLDFRDILDKLEATYMHYLEFRKGKWGFANEIIYLHIADTEDVSIPLISEVDSDVKQGIYDFVVTYHTGKGENTMLYGGLRHIDIDTTVETTSVLPPLNLDLEVNKDWTNLVVGVRQIFPLNDNWTTWIKGNIASDFDDESSYFLTLGANYTISKLLDLKFGYRYAEIEYEDSDIEINETIDGAFVGLTFKW